METLTEILMDFDLVRLMVKRLERLMETLMHSDFVKVKRMEILMD